MNLRCVDHHRECEAEFGSQLWYFDGFGVNEADRRVPIYGVIEYSIQFGLHELVEDGVFEHGFQRERFLNVYHREQLGPAWRVPAHRWIAAMMVLVSVAVVGLLLKTLVL